MLYLFTLMSISDLQRSISIVRESDLSEGDHIFRFGAIFKNSFLTHHGIYVGDGKVIHFSGGESKTNDLGKDILDAEIKLVSYNDFINNYDCFKINDNYTPSKRSEIVARAFSKLNSDFGGYSPSHNNCEHFANWCRTGIKTSLQTEMISEYSKMFIDSIKINNNKLKDINKILKEIRQLLKPLENFSSKIVLTNSVFDVLTGVIFNKVN